MLKALTPVRKTALLLFLGISFCYISLMPGTVGGRGYVNEELESGSRMLEVFNAWVKGRTVPPMLWSRHGPIPVLFDLPFIKIGKFFISPDFVLSLQPILLTAALVTLLFLWLRKLCSPRMSLLLALTGAFGTMLWPYAYIGLETKQSLLVLLAGYLALANGKMRGWPKLLLLALVCGLALTVKSTGIVMWPAFAYILYAQFRDDWRSHLPQLLVLPTVVVGVVALGAWGRNFYWAPQGGGLSQLLPWIIDTPLNYFTNFMAVFGSPNKGFLVYCPVLIVSLFAIPAAYRANRDATIFAVLVAATTAGFISLLKETGDEVWGCRFMHVAIAPLLLCIGSASSRFQWKKHLPLVFLSLTGVAISFLGAFFYYGTMGAATDKSGQNTMEWFYGDPVWNEIVFDSRILRVWVDGGNQPVPWTPRHQWVWAPPPGTPDWITVNLQDYKTPQSFMVQFWNVPKSGDALTIFSMCFFSLIAGPLLLLWVVATKERSIPENP